VATISAETTVARDALAAGTPPTLASTRGRKRNQGRDGCQGSGSGRSRDSAASWLPDGGGPSLGSCAGIGQIDDQDPFFSGRSRIQHHRPHLGVDVEHLAAAAPGIARAPSIAGGTCHQD